MEYEGCVRWTLYSELMSIKIEDSISKEKAISMVTVDNSMKVRGVLNESDKVDFCTAIRLL